MKFAICDDEALHLETIHTYIKEYSSLNCKTPITVSSFSCSESLLEDIERNGEYDVYFLDIIMPGMNGITLGRKLRENDCHAPIIYLTSSPEFAVDSYRVRAYDYLLKPVKKEDLFSSLTSLLSDLSPKNERFTMVRTRENNERLMVRNIMYARLSNRVISYYMTDGQIIQSIYIRGSFSDAVSDLLLDDSFILCGVSLAINLKHLTRLENNTLFFGNNHPVSVGSKVFRSIRSAWFDFCMNREF